MAGLGENLRTAREKKGLTVEELARETRISARFLHAIESEDFGVLPGGLFNRGFIRTYASKLGIDPDLAVQDYQAVAEGATTAPADGGPAEVSDSRSRRWPVGPIALAGLIVLFVLAWAIQQSQRPQEEAALESPASQSEAPVAARIVPLRSTPAAAPDPAPPPGTPMPDSDPAVPSFTPPPEEPERAGGVKVEILVHEETWVWAEADGRVLTGEWGLTLAPGRSQSFTAQQALELKIGNAGGVTLTVNGREISDVGDANQVRTLTITPENAATLAGS